MSFAIIARMKKPTDLKQQSVHSVTNTDTPHALVYIN